jgi:hypothetical protein
MVKTAKGIGKNVTLLSIIMKYLIWLEILQCKITVHSDCC